MGDDYYSNLLRSDEQFLNGTWDDSQLATPIGTQPSPIVESSVPVRMNTKRTISYKECEDKLLVSSWLNTSLDAAIGAEQSSSAYWKRIHLSYHANKTFVLDRNMSSLSNRWGTIRQEVTKFNGWYIQVQNRNQSGVTFEDKVYIVYLICLSSCMFRSYLISTYSLW